VQGKNGNIRLTKDHGMARQAGFAEQWSMPTTPLMVECDTAPNIAMAPCRVELVAS
jgi:hypothetical protein